MGPWIIGRLIRFGEVASKHFGVPAINSTGGALTKGTLVYLSGFDATTGRWKVSKAIAGLNGVVAHYATGVLTADVAIGNSCTVRPAAKVTGLNTSGRTIGDSVYLDPATAGGYTYSNPVLSSQIVGIVSKVDATDGAIEFDLPYLGSHVNSNAEGGLCSSASITLTPAQIIALKATPITVVPAPPAGYVIELVSGGAYLAYGSAGYTASGTLTLQLKYKDGTGAAASEILPNTGFVAALASTAVGIEKISTGTPVAKTVCDGQPLVIHQIGGSELASGDSPIRIRVMYRVVPAGW
jgi:hypothetical protein